MLTFFFDGVPIPERSKENNTELPSDIENTKRSEISNKEKKTAQSSTHDPYKKKLCNSCHTQSTKATPTVNSQFCYNCHAKDDLAEELNHLPASNGECLQCHDPHSSQYPSLLIRPTSKLCFACHSAQDVDYQERHEPLEDQSGCEKCHFPHGGKRSAFLKSDRNICQRCHPVSETAKVLHLPVKTGNCRKCHLDHNSDNPDNLISDNFEQLCMGCHEPDELASELNHFPAAEGNCLECHDPHVSSYAGLLRRPSNEGCFGCHDANDADYLARHERLKQTVQCERCHNPHGGESSGFLKSGLDVCKNCHPMDGPDGLIQVHRSTDVSKVDNCRSCHPGHIPKEK